MINRKRRENRSRNRTKISRSGDILRRSKIRIKALLRMMNSVVDLARKRALPNMSSKKDNEECNEGNQNKEG